MKATDVIKRDHEAAKALFAKFKSANEEEREAMETEIFDALTKHERMEDSYFYQALRDHDVEGGDILSNITVEQKELETEVAAARALPGDRTDRILSIMDKVLRHATTEENEILPQAEKLMSATELEELGERMEPESASAE